MTSSSPARARPRAAGPATRRSLRRRLAGLGLEGTRLEGARGRLGTNAATQAERLGVVLEELGLPGQAFAGYLSSRVDLLPAVAREPLAAAASRCPPLDRAEVHRRLRAELADEPETVFGGLELLGSGPVCEWHRGELASGERVVLELLRPELPEALEAGLQPLDWLTDSLRMTELGEALESWRAGLGSRLDLRRERQERAELSPDSFVTLSCTEVSPRLRWFRVPEGRSLVDELREARREATTSARARQVAQWLALAWFEEALLGRRVPDELEAPDLWVLDTDRVAMGGGHFRTLTSEECASAQAFFSAVAREEPEAAARSVLSLLTPGPEAEGAEQLVLRFCRAEPFREGLGFEPYRGRRLADQLFVLWRQCHAAGYRATPGLLALERGVARLETIVRRLAPESDALGSALDDVRVLGAFRELREHLAPSRLPATLSRSVPPLLEVLRRAERGTIAGLGVEGSRAPAGPRTGTGASGWPVVLGAVGLLAAATWLALRVLPLALGSTAGDRLAAVLVLLAGGGALWWLARGVR